MVNYRCAITGANGYLGSVLCDALLGMDDIEVVPLSRNGQNAFNLDDGLSADYFKSKEINCLIHCAWDFNANDDRYLPTNFGGTVNLFKAANEAGVEKMIFISSMSAFENCKSKYGATKFKTELNVLSMGVIVIRPGLVYGDKPRGMLGALSKLLNISSIIPLVGGGRYIQYTTHEEDLVNLLKELIMQPESAKKPIIVAANETGMSFKEILDVISTKAGKAPIYISVPWRIVWATLVMIEKMKISFPFKSDSVIGLVFPNPNPNFDGLSEYNSKFSRFKA